MQNLNKNIIVVALMVFVLAISSVIFVNDKSKDTVTEIIVEPVENKSDKIILDTPKLNEKVNSPIKISGKARGAWFFEASFPVFVVDWDGRIIGQGIAEAKNDWMTEDFVPFEANISYVLDPDIYSKKGAIILKKDNPSGLSENDDALEIQIELQ